MDQKAEHLPNSSAPADTAEWHVVGEAADFTSSEARAVDVAGRRLVVFRNADGALQALDARCPHMGADLGGAPIGGDEIICPEHFWRWDGAGRCTLSPYRSFRVPKRLEATTWPVREQDGVVSVRLSES